MEVFRIELLGEQGRETSRFRLFEAFIVRLTCIQRQPVSRPVFSLRLQTTDGLLLGETSSEDLATGFPRSEGTSFQLSVRLSNPLSPGRYRMSIKVKDGQRFIDRIEGIPLLVGEVSAEGGAIPKPGLLQLDARWRIAHGHVEAADKVSGS
jgi:hypothetical protein